MGEVIKNKTYKEVWNYSILSVGAYGGSRTANITSDITTQRTYENRRWLARDLTEAC